jgi:hypothetical protein
LRAWKLAVRNGRSLWWRSGHSADFFDTLFPARNIRN